MHVKEVKIHNFRNIQKTSINFKQGINVLYGDNGQGKTNIIEAINLSLTGKSHRENSLKNFIGSHGDTAVIELVISNDDSSEYEFSLTISQNKKIFSLDGERMKRRSEFTRLFPVVLFNPEDLKLVKNSPKERRDYLDDAISIISSNYILALDEYRHILAQKALTLKNYSRSAEMMLDIYDEQLSEKGTLILKYRIRFLRELQKMITQYYAYTSGNKEVLAINYLGTAFQNDDLTDINRAYRRMLKETRANDIRLQSCTVGIHRDDIKILMNGNSAQSFASQGQQRSIALCLRLSLIGVFRSVLNETPIVLLDDVMSELDEDRRDRVLKIASESQTIITCTDKSFFKNQDLNFLHVSNGTII